LTPESQMINSKKRKRCTNSITSASSPLTTKRGGTRAEFTAKFPQNTRVGADAGGAVGSLTRFRGELAPTWTVLACSNRPDICATSLSPSGKRRANPSLRVRSKATRRHRTSLSPRPGMSVAVIFAMRVADPSAQPGRRRRNERV
jgi:hypothetical protein